jgi:hypothetical protein
MSQQLPPKQLLLLLRAITHHCIYKSVDLSMPDILSICSAGGVTDEAVAIQVSAALEGLVVSAIRDDWTVTEMTSRCAPVVGEPARDTISSWWRDNRAAIRAFVRTQRWQPQLLSADWTTSTLTATGASAQVDPEPSVRLMLTISEPSRVEPSSFGVECDRVSLGALLRGVHSCLAAIQPQAEQVRRG